jgi:hypothetical protein
MVATTVVLQVAILALLGYQLAANPSATLWIGIPYVLAVAFLLARARRLKRRVAALVGAAAQRCGFKRV